MAVRRVQKDVSGHKKRCDLLAKEYEEFCLPQGQLDLQRMENGASASEDGGPARDGLWCAPLFDPRARPAAARRPTDRRRAGAHA